MSIYGSYPQTRLRRSRSHNWSRRLVREHELTCNDLIWPLFIVEGHNTRQAVASLPGVERFSIDLAVGQAKKATQLGIPVIALFPVTPAAKKSDQGGEAINPDNLICQAIRAIKSACPDIGIMTDVALDPYTTHGHDGILVGEEIANDQTVGILVQQALVQAKAGADIIAPSDMQDGRIRAIRQELERAGYHHTLILSYAAKYASSFYGPFRDAVGSGQNLGKKSKDSYQQDPGNCSEARREIALDIQEGADMVMVKPGMPYLDIIKDCASNFNIPVFAYQVSGEYAMLQAAIQNGWLDRQAIFESLLACKRAGAAGIVTYFALQVAQELNKY